MKLIANLNGDFFCPFQLLLDIAAQLPYQGFALKRQSLLPICELNSTNDWINLEALGKPQALRAKTMADMLTPLLLQNNITHLELHILLPEAELSSDNLYAMLFLAQALTTLDLFFYLNTKHSTKLNDAINALYETQNISIDIQSDDAFLKDSSHITVSNQLEVERYALLEQIGFHFHTGWIENSVLYKQQAHALIGYAWTCLKAGAPAPGCKMLAKGLEKAGLSPEIYELWFMHLQLIRFLSHQYHEVATTPFPDHYQYLSHEDIFNLNFVKAYCATLSRHKAIAKTYFQKAGINENMELNDEASLYHLNLYALLQVLEGNMALAFSLEMRIQSYIEQEAITTVGLKYVNFINIARLHKKNRQFTQAFSYYEKAYQEISGGGYTPSDHLYYHLNLASLYEATNQPAQALSHWLQAGLHWITMPNQHALAWRPRLILCQETLSDILKPLSLSKVSEFLYQKLDNALLKAGYNPQQLPHVHYDFTVDDQGRMNKNVCYMLDNIIFYTTNEQLKTQESQAPQRLCQLISGYLKSFLPRDHEAHTLVLDSKKENQLFKSDEALWLHATLSGAKTCYRNHKELVFNLQPLLDKVTISLANSIQSLKRTNQGLAITGKRSFLNQVIEAENDIMWLIKLANKQVSGHEIQESDLPVLKRLFNQKLITIDCPTAIQAKSADEALESVKL